MIRRRNKRPQWSWLWHAFGRRRMAYKNFGGITGDIQGFFLQIL
ncbi:MAG: hypothetical protein ACLTDV_05020 [Eubacterium sp.]